LENQGQVREAEAILLNIIKETEGPDSSTLELGVALNNLAVLYVSAGRYADGERAFMRSMRALKTVEGELYEQVLSRAKLHLAAMYIETGRGEDAAKLNLPRLLDILKTPEDKARAKTTLAALAMARKDLDHAESSYLEVLSFWRDPVREADNTIEIATILNNLGVIALWRGQTDASRRRLEESFTVWQRILGPESPILAKTMGNVGMLCMEAKDYPAALMWLGRALASMQKTLGELHPFTVAAQFAYAKALKKSGRKSEASYIARAANEASKSMRSPSTSGHIIDYRDMMSLKPKAR
jgi:tetratricopeptide (TPR) repeat protein